MKAAGTGGRGCPQLHKQRVEPLHSLFAFHHHSPPTTPPSPPGSRGRSLRHHVRPLVEQRRGDPRAHGSVRHGLVDFRQQSVGRAAGGCPCPAGRSVILQPRVCPSVSSGLCCFTVLLFSTSLLLWFHSVLKSS